jgi:coatomer subunit beta'
VFSYGLSLTVIQYQTAILRGDLDSAASLLDSIPSEQRARVARFLESQDLKDLALEVSTDLDQRFDLSIQLGKLDIASEIAHKLDTELKWRTLGDVAMSSWNFSLAEECLQKAKDLSGLLLFYTANGNREGIRKVADTAIEQGKNNIAFTCLFELGEMKEAIELLIKTDRIPEAAMLARTYAPDEISRIVGLWKAGLESKNRKKTAESLADPKQYPNLFPELQEQNKQTATESLIDAQVEETQQEEEEEGEEEEEELVDASDEPEEEKADSPSLI